MALRSSTCSSTTEQIRFWEDQVGVNFEYGEYDGALESAERLLKLDETREESLLLKCDILILTKRFAEAHEFLEGLAPKIPNSFDFLKGHIYHNEGRYELAIVHYNKSLQKNPLNLNLWRKLFEIYFLMEKTEELWIAANKSLRFDSEFVDAWIFLGSICLDKEAYAEAISFLDHAQKLDPHHPQIYYFKSMAYLKSKSLEDAIESQKTGINLEKSPAVKSLICLASLYFQANRYQDCIAIVDSALSAAKDDDKSILLQLKLESVFSLKNKEDMLDFIDENDSVTYVDASGSPNVLIRAGELLKIVDEILNLNPNNRICLMIKSCSLMKAGLSVQAHDILFNKLPIQFNKNEPMIEKQILLLRLACFEALSSPLVESTQYVERLLHQYLLWRDRTEKELINKYNLELSPDFVRPRMLVDARALAIVEELKKSETFKNLSKDETTLLECITRYCTNDTCLLHPIFDATVLFRIFHSCRKLKSRIPGGTNFLDFWNFILDHFVPLSCKIRIAKSIIGTLNEQGNYVRASQFVKLVDLLSIDGDDSHFTFQKAMTYLGLGDDKEALRLFEKVLQSHPDHLGAIMGRFQCVPYLSPESVCHLEENANKFQNNLQMLFYKASADYLCGEYEKSLLGFDRVLELDSTYKEALFGRIKCLYALKRYKIALQSAQKLLETDSDVADYWIYLSMIQRELHCYSDSERSALAAYNLDPKNPQILTQYIQLVNLKICDYIGKNGLLDPKFDELLEQLSRLVEQCIGVDPHNMCALSSRIMLCIHRGDLDGADGYCDEALRLVPDSVEMLKNRAMIAYRRGNWHLALEILDGSVLKNARNAEDSNAHFQALAIKLDIYNHHFQGDGDDVVSLACNVARLYPRWIFQIIHIVSKILMTNKKFSELLEILDTSIGVCGDCAVLYYYRSEANRAMGRLQHSEADLDEALNRDSENPLFLQALYRRWMDQSRPMLAFLVAKKLYSLVHDSQFLFWMITSALEARIFDSALQCVDSALQCVGSTLQNVDSSLQSVGSTLQPDSDCLQLLMAKNNVLLLLGQFQEVLQLSDRILKFDPFNLDCLLLKGSALFASGRLLESIECFNYACSINDSFPWFHHFLALLHFKSGDLSKAIKLQKSALLLSENNPDPRFLNNLACYFYLNQNPTLALSLIDQALNLPNPSKELWLNKSIILHSQGLVHQSSLASIKAHSLPLALNPIPLLTLSQKTL